MTTIPDPPPRSETFVFKVVDIGTISPEKFQAIFDEVHKLWAKDMIGLMEQEKSPSTFKEQFKADLTNAAYRVGSKQILQLTKNCIVQYARKSCSDEGKIALIVDLLDTELGTAITSTLIATMVSQLPQLKNHPRMRRILKEFRVSGLTTVGNSAVETVMAGLLPVIGSALQGIEEQKKLDETKCSSPIEEEELAYQEETAPPLQRQS